MKKGRMALWLAGLCCLVVVAGPARAELTLAAVFGSGMVLQRGAPMPVWGEAAPGEAITVTLLGATATGKAAADGTWRVDLPALEAGGPYELRVAGGPDGGGGQLLTNVWVGDVWLVAGGATVDMYANNVPGGGDLLREAHPRLRLLHWPTVSATGPLRSPQGRVLWVDASMESGAAAYSGLAIFFGLDLQRQLGAPEVPIALIQASATNSLVECWTPRPALENDPELKPLVEAYDQAVAAYRATAEGYTARFKEWVQAVDEAERLGAAYPPQPPLPAEPRSDPRKPCGYYDGTLAPLLPVPIKGVVWCHGDHNVQRAAQHRRLFAALIHGWREAWNNPQLPVVFTQSAGPGGEAVKEPAADSWADLRASQEAAKALPTTAMVPTLDIGMSAKTVPEIARRLARAALTAAYGRPMDGDGAGGAGEDAR